MRTENETYELRFGPVMTGFDEVGSMEWLHYSFEMEFPVSEIYADIPEHLWDFVRTDALMALENFQSVVQEIMQSKIQHGINNGKTRLWNASTAESAKLRASKFLSDHYQLWASYYPAWYMQQNLHVIPGNVLVDMASYVEHFVKAAQERIPHVAEDSAWTCDDETDDDDVSDLDEDMESVFGG